ncbi:MAG TPA: sigma-54 dependent transcriptional regulator [Polyangiaceae bacterium]|jgi:two-component system response regulator HydG|nr:sigma-54 dependent transcriptional regulator [Polyangiaceae bacterium]
MQEPARRASDAPTRALAKARILVVDDEPDACEAVRQVLVSEGYDATGETSACRALERVGAEDFDLVLSDVSMREMNGVDLCRHLVEARPGMPVVLVTGRGTMETAILAMRSGARDFLTKPVQVDSLIVSVVQALQYRAQGERSLAGQVPSEAAGRSVASVLGESVPMRRLRELIVNLSASAASILIQGETGTGKELIARAVHENSRFRAGPFMALNCAAVPAGLLESELFGHARGAFTDAKAARVGLLVRANGGTVFLDEVGDLPLAMQPKLLRALQERRVRPLGESEEVPFEGRIVAASNQDLDAEVTAKRFRADLYYRLDVVRLSVPPLRERGSDILLLAQHFLARFDRDPCRDLRLGEAAALKLLSYDWPGNVRELENCIERAVALGRASELTVDDLPERIRSPELGRNGAAHGGGGSGNLVSLSDLERRHTLRAVELLGGNMTRAARLLGIDRTTLYRRLKRYESSGPN